MLPGTIVLSLDLHAAAAMLLLRRGAHPCIVDHGGHLPHHYLASGRVSCFEHLAAGDDARAAAVKFAAALLDLSRGQSVVSAPAVSSSAGDAAPGGDHELADADAFGVAVTAAIRRPWLAYRAAPLLRSVTAADLLALRAGDGRTPEETLLHAAADGGFNAALPRPMACLAASALVGTLHRVPPSCAAPAEAGPGWEVTFATSGEGVEFSVPHDAALSSTGVPSVVMLTSSCIALRGNAPTADASSPAPAEVWASEAAASVAVRAEEGECSSLSGV